ncbi:Clavaminate synthase-like protein [Athelia psychrophila]|uniref:Clavaminate synthase-like protein n=1 Tax=Athelia psychrophila TaxID=1759441 RepID=A0A166WCM5_9AGAM|nr:Clavaminate synthase-like protein [Fibularhizoctonia sp. CBS 109695]
MATVTVSQLTDTLKQHLNLSAPDPEIKGAKPQQPDIAYQPDRAKWEARTARRLAANPSLPSTPLPAGFPKKLESPLVWEGSDWKDEKDWVHALTPSELDEIAGALKHFRGLDKPLGLVSQATFPLPTLGPVLAGIARELHAGRGFAVLRGIPVDAYSREEVVIVYAGVSSYVGNLRGVQDARAGGVLAHIKDLSALYDARAIGSPAYTTDKQVFHTDVGDIISLLALQTAAEGGVSKISSSWRVYNHIAAHRPDLIATLSQPWPFDGFGGDPPYTARPLLGYADGKLVIQYARRALTGFQGLPRSAGIPPLSEAQAEALDTLHFLAERYALSLDFQRGDIQYVNNLSVFHARDGFRDDEAHTRHLVRLWLRNEELAWQIPAYLDASWQRQYYALDPEKQVFALEPEIRSASQGVKY